MLSCHSSEIILQGLSLRWVMDAHDQVCGSQGARESTIHNFTNTGHPVVLPSAMALPTCFENTFQPPAQRESFRPCLHSGNVKWIRDTVLSRGVNRVSMD